MSNYDFWKSTDSRDGADGSADRAPCTHAYKVPISKIRPASVKTCNVPYEDHDDEALGHAYEMPEPEPRDY